MAGPTLLDVGTIADEIAATDVFYLVRGVGAGRDKQITGDLIVPTILTQNTTVAINLNLYKGDLVIFSTPAAGITLTLNNMLPNGRRLIVVNKATDQIITLAGNGSGAVQPNDQRKFVSDATSLFEDVTRLSINEAVANYVITDTDGYDSIEMTTAATNRTVTLPTLADNQGRVITIVKVDSGLAKVIIDGEGAETINGVLTIDLWNQYDAVKIIASSTEWKILTIINEEKENLLINGNFRFAQRGANGTASFTAATTPANNDDTYLLDRWILLSDGNDIVDVSQDTSIPRTRGLSMESLVATINKKWGFLQVIENAVASELQDRKVSLSFYARTTTGAVISNIRAAVISWDGAVDTVTSDVVNAWNAAGANPTLVANWTYENTPANLALVSDVWTKYTIEGIEIDTAGTNNVGVFIWVDDDDGALNDEMFLAEVSLTLSDIAVPVKYRQFEEELARCQRYYEKSYDLGTAPGTAGAGNDKSIFVVAGTNIRETATFLVSKRIAPTGECYSPGTGAAGNARDDTAAADRALDAIEEGMEIISIRKAAGGLVDNNVHSYYFTADAEL